MKLLPILTALVVAAVIFGIVIERDAFQQLLSGNAAPDAVVIDDAPPPTASQPTLEASNRSTEAAVINVVAQTSRAQKIDNVLVVRGRTEADRQVTVMSQTSGLIISEPLDKGSFVSAGDIICEIEPGTRPASLTEARARLAEAEINKTAAERLSKGGFTSETQLSSAIAAWESAAAAVEVAQTEMDRTQITAPFDGVLETDSAELGTLVQPGAACATIIRLDPIRVVGFVPEVSVDKVRVGAMAQARLSTGRMVSGEVIFVSRAADEATRTFRVDIAVENRDLTIRDGQTAEIGIQTDGSMAHLVPQSALTLDDDGQMGLRIITDDNRAAFVPVAMVRDTADGVFLTGLPEETRIIIVGQEYVTDGVAVRAFAPGERS